MKKATNFSFIIAVFLAGIAGDFIHVYYGHLVSGIPIYNFYINLISFLSKSLEALGIALVYYLIGDRLYTDSRLGKAIFLTLLICLIKDGFIRQPVMNILLGNSVIDSLRRESQAWLTNFVMSLIITFKIKPKMEQQFNEAKH